MKKPEPHVAPASTPTQTPAPAETLPPAVPNMEIAMLALIAAAIARPQMGDTDEMAIERAYKIYEKAKTYVGQ